VSQNENTQLKKSIDTLNYSIKQKKAEKKYEELSKLLQKQSYLFLTRLKNFEKAMELIEEIKQLSDVSKNKSFLIDYYNQLGVSYYYEDLDLNKSFSYFKKALELSKELKLENNISRTLSNYGLAYLQQENYGVALNYFRQAIASYKKEFKKDGNVQFYSNMGVAYIYAGKPDSAELYLKKALELSYETPSLSDDADRLMYLGVFHQERGNNEMAISYLTKAFQYINQLISFRSKILVCQGLADAFAEKKQFEEAYKFRCFENKYRDSLRISNFQENALSFQYKSELDSLKNYNKIQTIEKDKQKQEFTFYTIIIVLGLISVIMISIYSISRSKNKQRKLELMNEKEKLEKKQVQLDLENNEREVASKSIFLLEKDNLMRNISDKLKTALPKLSEDAQVTIKELISELNFSVNNKSWDEFELRFNKVHPSFYSNLEKEHPKLSSNERKLCAFLLMNMSSKEISNITGQTVHSINIARGRLRNKLKLVHSGEDLSLYLSKYAQQNQN